MGSTTTSVGSRIVHPTFIIGPDPTLPAVGNSCYNFPKIDHSEFFTATLTQSLLGQFCGSFSDFSDFEGFNSVLNFFSLSQSQYFSEPFSEGVLLILAALKILQNL